MKNRRTSTKIKNTSKRNVQARETLKEALPGMREKIYAEYPYWDIVGSYSSDVPNSTIKKLKADIFIKDYHVAIELMGEQHYGPVAFGGDRSVAIDNFTRQKHRDYVKRGLAIHDGEMFCDGFILIEIPYYVTLPDTREWLHILHDVSIKGSSNVYLVDEEEIYPIDLDGNRMEGVVFERKLSKRHT